MLKIKDTLDEIILDNPFLEDAIYNSYLNISSFAEYIKPQIELLTKKEVTIASIKMTLSRASIKNRKKKYFKFQANNFFLRKDMSMINIEKTPDNHALINKIYENMEDLSSEYIAVIEGVKEIDVVYSSKIQPLIDKFIPKNKIKLALNDLSLIWIHLDKEILYTPGLFYHVSKKLFFYNINILQVISTYRELAILVDTKDTKRALEILQ